MLAGVAAVAGPRADTLNLLAEYYTLDWDTLLCHAVQRADLWMMRVCADHGATAWREAYVIALRDGSAPAAAYCSRMINARHGR